jgi:RimJ/RimL family protein N-acetyltransferase
VNEHLFRARYEVRPSSIASYSAAADHVRTRPTAVQFDERTLEKSWEWLNDEEIRRLTMTPAFTREEQRAWFASLTARTDYMLWAIEFDANHVGVFGLKHIDSSSAEYWGYIGEKQLWGHGLGTWMVNEAVTKARGMGLQRIWLRVAHENVRAQRLYVKMGFHKTNENCDPMTMERNV